MIMPGYIMSLLESCNINCIIKNQLLAGAIGEIPPIECWPEVWIMDDEDYDDAMEIVDSVIQNQADSKMLWKCTCGETIEGQFDTCWSCGKEKTQ